MPVWPCFSSQKPTARHGQTARHGDLALQLCEARGGYRAAVPEELVNLSPAPAVRGDLRDVEGFLTGFLTRILVGPALAALEKTSF
jgi:hypothetical protein